MEKSSHSAGNKNKAVKFTAIKAFAAVLLLCLIFLTGCAKEEEVSKTDFMMDTFVTHYWKGENSALCYEEIKALFEEAEKNFSTYDEESFIYKINKMSGKEAVRVSDEVFSVLKRAKELSLKTDGSFDITVSPLVKLWDVSGENPKVPQKEDIDREKSLVSVESLILDEENKTAFLEKEGSGIDLGAVLKGYLAGEALATAKKYQVSGYISVGGNMAVCGKKGRNADYKIGIRDPRGESGDYTGVVTLENLTMSTAGDYERYFIEDGIRYHHILDPKTGYPAKTDIISASVISEDGFLADFLSTYIFMSGTENLSRFDGFNEFSYLVIDKDENIHMSEGFKDRFQENS